MKGRLIFAFFLLTASFSCRETDQGYFPLLYTCTSELGCGNGENVPYCTWGYKFGDNNPFTPSGPNIPGPGTKATTISYRFIEGGIELKTSFQNKAVSIQFNEESKNEIRKAISEWSSDANVTFIEKSSSEATSIAIAKTFAFANGGVVGGLGYPNFTSGPCQEIAGLLVVNSKFKITYSILLHEMGHVLGLGHVTSQNIMNPTYSIDRLQSGDIKGIQSIYGSK